MQERNLTGWVAVRWIAVLLVVLALPATALAQTPPDDQYGQPPGTQPTPTPTPSGTGSEQENPDGDDGDDGDEGGDGEPVPGGDGGSGPGGAENTPGGVTATDLPLRDAEGGSLPFTGVDLSLIVLLGLLAVGGGFAIRAVQRRNASPG